MRRKPGSLRHRFKTPNGASRRSAQAPAAAQYTPPQRQQPHYYTARPQHNAVVSGTRARSICKSPQNASRGNARRRNESPPKRRGHNTMRSYPVCARIICKSPQNASRGNTCLQNESPQTRTRCKVKGDAEKHLLFHNPRLRTRSQSPATAIRPSAGKG